MSKLIPFIELIIALKINYNKIKHNKTVIKHYYNKYINGIINKYVRIEETDELIKVMFNSLDTAYIYTL